jgi:hypothetical protein
MPILCSPVFFALGIGLAFLAPVWGAIVPDIVDKEELPSAITLGGVQPNRSIYPELSARLSADSCCRSLALLCLFRSTR